MTTETEVGEVLAAFFGAVSFVAGGRPDYESIRGLFVEDGRLIDTATATVSTVEQFIVPRRAAVDAGSLTEFREVETGAETQSFGNVAHRFSSYTKAGVRDGDAFVGRGMISTQFIRTPDGWRITVMAWDDERPAPPAPLPASSPAPR